MEIDLELIKALFTTFILFSGIIFVIAVVTIGIARILINGLVNEDLKRWVRCNKSKPVCPKSKLGGINAR